MERSPTQVVVFAAASATDVMREAGKRFEAKSGVPVVFSFDSSSNLARQIKAGSPADVFLAADEKWMDDVEAAGAIRSDSRHDLLGNAMVLIIPAGSALDIDLANSSAALNRLAKLNRFAIGNPEFVPAGRYAREALTSLGWWKALEPRMIPTLDVRAALRLVETQEADIGIVYATDAKQSNRVSVAAEIPSNLHTPIRYPIAQCSDSPIGAHFMEFLRGDEMAAVFRNAGFQVLLPIEDR